MNWVPLKYRTRINTSLPEPSKKGPLTYIIVSMRPSQQPARVYQDIDLNMSDNSKDPKPKTIALAKLSPADYRVRVSQLRATLEVYRCLKIIDGSESQPDENGATPPVLKQIASWNAGHALAKEALLKYLDSAGPIKVHDLNTASEIWARLASLWLWL